MHVTEERDWIQIRYIDQIPSTSHAHRIMNSPVEHKLEAWFRISRTAKMEYPSDSPSQLLKWVSTSVVQMGPQISCCRSASFSSAKIFQLQWSNLAIPVHPSLIVASRLALSLSHLLEQILFPEKRTWIKQEQERNVPKDCWIWISVVLLSQIFTTTKGITFFCRRFEGFLVFSSLNCVKFL